MNARVTRIAFLPFLFIFVLSTFGPQTWQNPFSPLNNQAAASPVTATTPVIIATSGKNLVLDGLPFIMRGVNYYPKDYAWDRFWTNYVPMKPPSTIGTQIDNELQQAQLLGINTLRIFIPYGAFGGPHANASYPGYLVDFLKRLKSRGMFAIVTLFDFYPSTSAQPYKSADYAASKNHIDTVIKAVIDSAENVSPVVLAWDIKNEIDRDYTSTLWTETDVKAWAHEMITYARSIDTQDHLITVGVYGAKMGTPCYASTGSELVYDPQFAVDYLADVDLVSMHYFLSERCFESGLQSLISKVGEKPVILEEFGLHTLANPPIPCSSNPTNEACDDPHTEKEQAAYFNALLSVSKANHIAGYSFWTLTDFSYIQTGAQQSHHCQGVIRNSLVTICEISSTADYARKPGADTIRRHYHPSNRYLDTFEGWVDPNTDLPPLGWSDNDGAILRGYKPSELLWSHTPGAVALARYSTTVDGKATSPALLDINLNHSQYLTGRVSSYSVRDIQNGSNADLRISVQEGNTAVPLLTIDHAATFPFAFMIDLRETALNWTGPHTFRIVLELIPEAGQNGYSATYELDWIEVRGFMCYLPMILR